MNNKELLIDFIEYAKSRHVMPILHSNIEPLVDDYLSSRNIGNTNVSGSGFSSTKSIVKFDTGKVKGLFISVPYNTIVDECHFKNKESLRFALIVCFGSKNAIPSFIPIVIPEGNYKIIGLSNKLNDNQIEELGLTYHEYLRLLGKHDITVNYSDFSNCWLVVVYA